MAAVTIHSDFGAQENKVCHCFHCCLIYLPWSAETFWRRQWHPTPVLLPGKSHGRRSLVGCSPWGREESDLTERLHFHFSLSCIGEGNGNPLQCSFLEDPRDGSTWWAVIYGVAQSRTRLKWLSSSNSSSRDENILLHLVWEGSPNESYPNVMKFLHLFLLFLHLLQLVLMDFR